MCDETATDLPIVFFLHGRDIVHVCRNRARELKSHLTGCVCALRSVIAALTDRSANTAGTELFVHGNKRSHQCGCFSHAAWSCALHVLVVTTKRCFVTRCEGLALLSCFGVRAMHCLVKKVVPAVCCHAVLCASVFVSSLCGFVPPSFWNVGSSRCGVLRSFVDTGVVLLQSDSSHEYLAGTPRAVSGRRQVCPGRSRRDMQCSCDLSKTNPDA